MTPTVAAALVDVAGLMRVTRQPWWIIGSGAVALYGADAGDVHDIDVLVACEDMAAVLAARDVVAQAMRPDPLFQSQVFAVWTGRALPIEIMAGFAVFSDGNWWPVKPASRNAMIVGGATVFAPGRDELFALLHRMGRPKDLRRAAALEEREPG